MIRRKDRWTGFFCGLFLITGTVTAHADRLDDDLRSVWESLWDERGTPRPLLRWETEVRYRISGVDVNRHREHIVQSLNAVADATHVRMTDVSTDSGDARQALLNIEVVEDRDLPENDACSTGVFYWPNGAISRVESRLKSRFVWQCALHEVVHAMGIPGHPSGNTVLSYFASRRDQLSELDKLMLGVWYSSRLKPGATPFEVLVVMTDAVAAQKPSGLTTDEIQRRVQTFNLTILRDMENFAAGHGEVPAIIKRSGRASSIYMDEARLQVGLYIGRAYQDGTIVGKDLVAAAQWFRAGAEKGYPQSQVLWGLALASGKGTARDQAAACNWYLQATPKLADKPMKELQSLELTLCPPTPQDVPPVQTP